MLRKIILLSVLFIFTTASAAKSNKPKKKKDLPGGTLRATRVLWPSPVQLVEVSPNGSDFAKRLTTSALKAFAELSLNETLRLATNIRPGEAVSNQQFYVYQQQQKARQMDIFSNVPEYNKLISHFEAASRRYLSLMGLDAGAWSARSPRTGGATDCWSSVHGVGSWHPPHHHVYSTEILSGVYYSSVPNGFRSGDLVFTDPRGAMPPFGQSHSVSPEEGLLVLFPSTLTHTVEPTPGGGWEGSLDAEIVATSEVQAVVPRESKKKGSFRVSFSCNMHGNVNADVIRVASSGLSF